MDTITSLPSLASTWTVATPSACPNLNPNEYWIWDYGAAPTVALGAGTVLGGPSQTTNGCLPTGWDGLVTYLGAQCPSGFSTACGGTYGSAYTCCPTVYSFSCVAPASNTFAPTFRCMSQYTSHSTATVTHWTVQQGPTATSIETRNLTSPNHLFAMGVIYTTPAPTSSASASTPPLDTTSSSSSTPSNGSETGSDSLTVGASAGIGVSVGVVVMLIAVLGWFAYRRRLSSNSQRHSFKNDLIRVPVSELNGTDARQNEAGINVNKSVDRTQLSELPEQVIELQ